MKKQFLLLLFLSLVFAGQAQVSKTVNVTAGGLSSALTSKELSTVTTLTITGTIDARDFVTMRENMPLLAVLDISAVKIVAYNGSAGTYKDTSYLANGLPVCAFYNSTNNAEKLTLTTIILPSSITSIGDHALAFCSRLTSVTIPSSVTFIGDHAFEGCTGTITVDPANANYSSLNGVLFNKAQTTLVQCPILETESYIIPSSVTSIGVGAFEGCGLTSVSIPSSVTSIGSHAFLNCSGLTSVSIPSSVTSIGAFTFAGCRSLTSVSIPSSVTSIGSHAFLNYNDLTSIYSYTTTPVNLSSSSNVFTGVNTNMCILYVPSGSLSAYQTANQWKDFAHIVGI